MAAATISATAKPDLFRDGVCFFYGMRMLQNADLRLLNLGGSAPSYILCGL
jgi:hypothetical protein